MFDIRVAEGITLSGKLAILWISRKLDEYMNEAMKTGPVVHKIHHISRPPETTVEISGGKNYAFYQDTDSVYLDMSALVDKMYTKQQQVEEVEKVVNFLDLLFKKKIEPFINECYKELAEYVNADEQRMFMKRENICISAIWCCHPNTKVNTSLGSFDMESLFNMAGGDGNIRYIEGMKTKSYSIDEQRFINDDLSCVMRKQYSGMMYEFISESGEVVRVTADHLILTKGEGDKYDVWKKAKDITLDDEIMVL